MRVKLELSEQQARVVVAALDAFSRVGCGQFDAVANLVTLNWPDQRYLHRPVAGQCLGAAQAALFPELGSPAASYSIANRAVPAPFRLAYDTMKHLQRAMAEARDPSPAWKGAEYEGADLNVSDAPLPTVAVETGEVRQ